ncbi:hypothetical protein KA012_04555 [Candidatus Woesebacteria bacterium]|nr:hypothetical protein [Candidatus Woesebacteria bacterium]
MKICPRSVDFKPLAEVRRNPAESEHYLQALYQWLLTDNTFASLWTCTGANPEVIATIGRALHEHLEGWNKANEATGVSWELKTDGNGWVGLESELEETEFAVFEQLWKLSLDSAETLSDSEFFAQANALVLDSRLFELLRTMQVTRVDGTTKTVWPHIEAVVSNLNSDSLPALEPYTAAERRGILRFTAFVHDIFNVVAIDNDWLQLHAHGGAAFIYRFLVTQMQMNPTEAASIVRVIDLHHVLQLQKVEGISGRDRVLEQDDLASFFASLPNGLEELGRLIIFSLADTSQRRDFQSEHVIASLGLIDIFLNMQPEMNHTKRVAVAKAAITAASEVIVYFQGEQAVHPEKVEVLNGLLETVRAMIEKLKVVINIFSIDQPHAVVAMMAA